MNETSRTALRDLAAMIARRRLLAPARLMLDIVEPFGFLASQMALFARPFVPVPRWRGYVAALTDEAGWSELQQLVDRHVEE